VPVHLGCGASLSGIPMNRLPSVLIFAVVVSACASHPKHHIPEDQRPREWHPARELLLKYDSDHDGTLTRAELEAGLKSEFEAADADHDGCLKPDVVRAINAQRIKDLGSTATPLIDWNQDGCVDFNEFAGPARSLFTQMDRNGDGKLDPKELNPAGVGKAGQGGGREEGHRHPGGERGPRPDGNGD
jgi:Ca2+-binding EF-hand superfamily protein